MRLQVALLHDVELLWLVFDSDSLSLEETLSCLIWVSRRPVPGGLLWAALRFLELDRVFQLAEVADGEADAVGRWPRLVDEDKRL